MDSQDDLLCPLCQLPFSEDELSGNYACPACREKGLNRPISKKVTVFVIGITIFSILMLYRLPASLSSAVQYERGLESAKNHYYLEATQSFEKVLKGNPNAFKVLVDCYEAQINSLQLDESQKTLNQLIAQDSTPEKSIADRVNAATDKAEAYYYNSEALTKELNNNANLSQADQKLKLEAFLKTNPSLNGKAILSEYLYAEGNYKAVVDLLEPEIKAYPDWIVGYNNLIPALRNLGEYDRAKAYALQYIEQWKDNTSSYIVAAKVEMARNDYQSALEIALKAPYSESDYYLNGILAILYSQLDNAKKQEQYYDAFNASKDKDQAFVDYVTENIKKSN